jgi:acetyltransferase-like isoleucine patch superfamily enzyme
MFDKLQAFFRQGPLDQLNQGRIQWWRLFTRCFHRPFFGSIGKKSFIAHPILITNPRHIFIGDQVTIRQGARLEVICSTPGQLPRLSIGNETSIEQNVHIVCHRSVQIGARVTITANCAIVDVTHPIDPHDLHGKIGARVLDEDSWVEIGDGAFLGVGTVVLPKVRIGAGAVIGANSVVTRDIPPYTIAAGAPARVLRTYAGPPHDMTSLKEEK